MQKQLADLWFGLSAWYYRAAPLLMVGFIDDPAMLALAFC